MLAAIWRRSLASMFAKPFGDLFDGGSVELEPHPYYSMAEAKRKKGLYTEAIAEIRQGRMIILLNLASVLDIEAG